MNRQLLGLALAFAAVAAAREPLYDKLWSDPEVELRIRTGIGANRMGFATLRFTDEQGKPVNNVEVDFQQTGHQFLFGCNIFLLKGFSTEGQNQNYEKAFRETFNFATAPFYWSDLEPEQGRLRFAVDAPFIRRRPQPDLVVDWCRRNNITVKGHNLIWHSWYPAWLPKDQEEVTRLARRRFEQIAERYGKSIPIWDVVNEPLERNNNVLPKDYTYWAMKEAERLFPPEAVLMVNEVTTHMMAPRQEESPFYMLLQNLFLRHARVDAIGLQYHLFSEQLYRDLLAGRAQRPRELMQAFDLYERFQRPIHITEITIPTLPAGGKNSEEDQAAVVRNLYRLWFSQRSVEAITWWNLSDGTAAPGEDKWGGGLMREDFSPKLSYKALDQLIHKEWWTHIERKSGAESAMRLHGFYGDYEITARRNGKTVRQKVRLSKTGTNEFAIQF